LCEGTKWAGMGEGLQRYHTNNRVGKVKTSFGEGRPNRVLRLNKKKKLEPASALQEGEYLERNTPGWNPTFIS